MGDGTSIVFHKATARIAVGVCLGMVLFTVLMWAFGVVLVLLGVD